MTKIVSNQYLLLMAFVLLSFFRNANAQSFVENNWKFDVVSNSELTLKIVGRSNPYTWPSITEIPSTVVHNGITFTVTQIGYKATHYRGESDGIHSYINYNQYCNGMTEIIVPSTITTIEDSAFWGCTNLANITFYSQTPPSIGNDAFLGVPLYAFVYTPCGTSSVFSSNAQLSQFSHFVDTGSYGTINVQANIAFNNIVQVTQEPSCTMPAIIQASSSVGNYSTSYYHFTSWNDGITNNPRIVNVTSDTTFTAIYNPDIYYVFCTSSDTNKGIAIGDSGAWNDTVYLTAIPKYGYHFAYWRNWASTGGVIVKYYDNPRSHIIGTSAQNLEAYFAPDTFSVFAYTDGGGRVTLNYSGTNTGMYAYLSQVTLHANPNDGNRFVMWSDSNLFQNRTITLYGDTTLTAIFAPIASLRDTIYDTVYLYDTIYIHDTIYINNDDIDGVDAQNAMVYYNNGQIVVEGADGNTVILFDLNGRMIATKQDYGTAIRFDVPTSGTYIIKIGHHAMRKVVVIR